MLQQEGVNLEEVSRQWRRSYDINCCVSLMVFSSKNIARFGGVMENYLPRIEGTRLFYVPMEMMGSISTAWKWEKAAIQVVGLQRVGGPTDMVDTALAHSALIILVESAQEHILVSNLRWMEALRRYQGQITRMAIEIRVAMRTTAIVRVLLEGKLCDILQVLPCLFIAIRNNTYPLFPRRSCYAWKPCCSGKSEFELYFFAY